MSAGSIGSNGSSVDPAERIDSHPDTLEVSPGFAHERLEGWIPELATETEIREALEKAFDYRGDVTITLKSGAKVEGYIFDRRQAETLAESVVRVFPQDSDSNSNSNSNGKINISYADIAALAFSGRDTAAGKSWEAWVRKYWERKRAGERGIALQPESLE